MVQLSVIIPSRDSGPRLEASLASLAAQLDADGAFEVVVVDDGSRTPVAASLAAPAGRFPVRVIRRETSGGIAVARNAGWQVAEGTIALFLDDDIAADRRLVAGHIAAHAGGKPRVGIGRLRTRVAPRADWLAQRFADAWNAHIAALDTGRPLKAGDCYGGDLSIPLGLLRTSGGFDEGFERSEDLELAARLVTAGATLTYVAGESVHDERKSGHAMLADARRNGAVAERLIARHPWLLRETELGSYPARGQRQLAVRRLLTRSGAVAAGLGRIGPILGGGRIGRAAASLLVHQAFWRGVGETVPNERFEDLTSGTAILMYHAFAAAGSPASRFVCPRDRLAAQLEGLLRAGRRPLALDDYLAIRRGFGVPPAGSFIVTIDDGYADLENEAVPVLRDLAIPATIFLVEGAIGSRNGWDRGGALANRPTLDPVAIDRIRREGFTFGSHSATHRPLDVAGAADLNAEIAVATERLASAVGPLVGAFAYPYGRASDAARAAVVGAGMLGLGVREGLACPASPDGELPRIEVHGGDSWRRLLLATRLGGTRRLLR